MGSGVKCAKFRCILKYTQYNFLNAADTNKGSTTLRIVIKIKDKSLTSSLRSKVTWDLVTSVTWDYIIPFTQFSIQSVAVINTVYSLFKKILLLILWPLNQSFDTKGEVRCQIWHTVKRYFW